VLTGRDGGRADSLAADVTRPATWTTAMYVNLTGVFLSMKYEIAHIAVSKAGVSALTRTAGRVSDPAEVAAAVTGPASGDAGFVVGTDLVVDARPVRPVG
jgi:hypothetical protein